MKSILFFFAITILGSCANSQEQNKMVPQLVGGPCEGCEAIFEYGDRQLSPVETLPGFDEQGQRIKVTGTVFQQDGKTPAVNVILYFYQTDPTGIYPTKGGETGWARKHGYIRGWIKTEENGKYTFYTRKPGIYPSRTDPAHIHVIVLEPSGKYYYLDSYHFEGDPLLTENETSPDSPRGGSSGLMSLKRVGDIMVGERDIILGRNIPGYE